MLKAIDKQTWKDKKARESAVKAIPAKAKAACSLGGAPQVVEVISRLTVTGIGGGRSETVRCPTGTVLGGGVDTLVLTPDPVEGDDVVEQLSNPDATNTQKSHFLAVANSDSGVDTTYTSTATVHCIPAA